MGCHDKRYRQNFSGKPGLSYHSELLLELAFFIVCLSSLMVTNYGISQPDGVKECRHIAMPCWQK